VFVYAGSNPGHDGVFYIFLHLIFVYFYCQNIRFCAIFVGIFIGLWSCTIITIHMTQYVLVSEHMNRMSKLIRALLSMWLKCQMSMARNARLLYVWAPMQYTPPPSLYETAWVFKLFMAYIYYYFKIGIIYMPMHFHLNHHSDLNWQWSISIGLRSSNEQVGDSRIISPTVPF